MRCKIPSRDLAQKLDHSICRYKGSPVYCRVVSKDAIALYRLNNTERSFLNIHPDDENFDVSGIPLGCIQSPRQTNQVLYLSRIPWRKTKQGFQYQSLVCRKLGETTIDKYIPATDVVFSQQFINMVEGRYTPLGEAILLLRKWHKENQEQTFQLAININIGLSINPMGIIFVYYKNQSVGWMAPDSMTVIVPHSDKSWIISKFLSHELSWKVE